MLYSIIQIIAFQALFLLVYDLFLRKETFFNYNRAYLLITSLLSLALPFIKFNKLKALTTQNLVIHLPEVFIGEIPLRAQHIQMAEQTGVVLEQPSIPIWQISIGIGMLITLVIFVVKILKLYRIKAKNPKLRKGNVLIAKLLKSSAAFSFFNTIFLGERIPKEERPTIYKHELIHIKEWHSLDLVYFEVLRIVLWFNPIVYLYQNRIKELHEYIADAKAVKQDDKSNYYQTLLNQIFEVNNTSFVNTFFKTSLIKRRIAMLQKSKSKQYRVLKYGLLIPLVLAMLVYTSAEVKAFQESELTQQSSQEPSEEELVKKYYKQMVSMEKNGATFFEIADYASDGSKSDKYILSKEEFLKMKAYMEYMSDAMIRRKSEKGTLDNKDFDTAELMKQKGKSYVEYRSWKKTKEAKDLWEASIKEGERKLFVEDMLNKTAEEQKRYDTLLNQLETDESVEKVIITDGKSLLILYPTQKDELHEIKIPAETSIEVPFSVIDEVPTTLDCKELETNMQRKKCMSDFVAKHVSQNFNIEVAKDLDIEGRQRIFVAFKIDDKGLLKDIKARASRKELEAEAVRVIKTLPQFIPGKHKGETVVVPYSLPTVFQTNAKQKGSLSPKDNNSRDSIRKSVLQKEGYYSAYQNQATVFSEVDVAPIYEDCKSVTDEVERRRCTSIAVSEFVNANFNLDVAKSLDLNGETQRVFTKFIIDTSGKVKDINVRAKHPELKKETIRVLNLLPQFVPGEQNGKPVNVAYSLPINFTLKK